jgi:FimV-like protein
VITITSSRPITDRELNIIIKIKEGNAARLQPIRTVLKAKTDLLQARLKQEEAPVVRVSEKDLALNLPVSTQYHNAQSQINASLAAEKPLILQRMAPPALSNSSIPKTVMKAVAVEPVTAATAQAADSKHATAPAAINTPDRTETASSAAAAVETPDKNTASSQKPGANQTASSDPLVKKYAEQQASKAGASADVQTQPKLNAKKQAKPVSKETASTPVKPTYVVQSNESLWGIASRLANQQQRPVGEVMQQIKRENEHAFIGGNVNRLRKGAALKLTSMPAAKAPVQVAAVKSAQTPSKPAGKTRYRLNEAEMSLVAENQRNSSQVSANPNLKNNQTSKEWSLKVMTAREKTVKLQRNVTESELALNQKDHRIQLLNVRLAQLQQQLKAQQADKKSVN